MKEGHANTDDWLLILLIINNIKVQEMGLSYYWVFVCRKDNLKYIMYK